MSSLSQFASAIMTAGYSTATTAVREERTAPPPPNKLKPKDLLASLEKGDRTLEMLKACVTKKTPPVEGGLLDMNAYNQMISGTHRPYITPGTIYWASSQLANTFGTTSTGLGDHTRLGGL